MRDVGLQIWWKSLCIFNTQGLSSLVEKVLCTNCRYKVLKWIPRLVLHLDPSYYRYRIPGHVLPQGYTKCQNIHIVSCLVMTVFLVFATIITKVLTDESLWGACHSHHMDKTKTLKCFSKGCFFQYSIRLLDVVQVKDPC